MFPVDRNQLAPLSKTQAEELWRREKAAIDEYKYLLSKELGRDCGYFHAYWNWNSGARDKWIKEHGPI